MAKKKKHVRRLSLREKCHLLHGNGNWHIHGAARLGIPGIEIHDGPLGLRQVQEGAPDDQAALATCYPSPALLACSWDEKLAYSVGSAMASEAASKNTSLLLTPGVNIKRNPLCGRNFEYLSEDPLLAGKMASGTIRGIQSQKVGACIKHFACNSQESYRNINDSIVDERALNEIYLKPFEIAIKEANPWSLMSSYNLINGIHASDNEYLLKTVLRERWGYEGVVMSDWGGTYDPIDSHNHGLDLEMPCCVKGRTRELMAAATMGRLSKAAALESANRIVNMLQKAKERVAGSWNPQKSHALAVSAAENSLVLLRNQDQTLPLKSFQDCAIIGAFAEKPCFQGNGSSHVNTNNAPSFLDAIKADRAFYAPGFHFVESDSDAELSLTAVDLASKCKTVLLFLGIPESVESEGYDRENINLPDNQIRLFDAISAVNSNIIVVLSCGAPLSLPFAERAKAILLSYLPGEGGQEAIANILLGKTSPSGKLAETWPLHLADVPSFGFYPGYEGQSLYKESIYVGYRYYLSCNKPVLFPFGHGLSYANFSYSLFLSSDRIEGEEKTSAIVEVSNHSEFAASTVIELYAETVSGQVFKPKRTLIAFKKVHLGPEENTQVEFSLGLENFAHYDTVSKSFKTEGGKVRIQLGSSCEDVIEERTLTLVSEDKFTSLRRICPIYYAVPASGFAQYDDEFEAILGRHIPLDRKRSVKPYYLDSTMSDIRDTFIGKKLRVYYFRDFVGKDKPEAYLKTMSAYFDALPIRGLCQGGLSSRQIQLILDFANGRYVTAILRYLFGRAKK